MSTGQSGWLLLLVLALVFMVIGFQGSLGVVIAILFCPKYVQIDTTAASTGGQTF